MKKPNALVVLSGGMDSTVLLHYVVKEYGHMYNDIFAITFDYGQRLVKEVDFARFQALQLGVKEHKVIKLDYFRDISTKSALTNTDIAVPKARDDLGNGQPVSYVPFRNMLLLTTAAAWAESVEAVDIFYGAVATDNYSGYWDCTENFLDKINDTFILNRSNKIQVLAPFVTYSKQAIVKKGLDLGVDFTKTMTCYNGTEVACGACVSCSARIKGFIDNQAIDPLKYEIEIPWSKYNCK